MNERTTLRYDYRKPLNLLEFADSLRSLNSFHEHAEYELHIEDIRKGSILVDITSIDPSMLTALAPMLPEAAEETHKFIKNIVGIINLLKKGVFIKENGEEITRTEAEAAHQVLAPAASDPGASFEINTGDNCHININYGDAGVTQNNASKWMQHLDQRDRNILRGVFLEWTNLSKNYKTGHKSIIENVSTNMVTTKFATEAIYNEMVKRVDKPFNHYWDVDVHVETLARSNKPVRYTIINVNEELTEKG